MSHIFVVGAGITGVTSAYALARLGHDVTVVDRHLCPAMETSFANGGQLSACNAEVWNHLGTIKKGLKWIAKSDAPLLLNPSFSLHKYMWLYEFISQIRNYQANTIYTVQLALKARQYLFEIAEREKIQFDLEKRGILHIFHHEHDFRIAEQVNGILSQGGLQRYAVSPNEMSAIEPALAGDYYAGFYTPDDATGDIFKFCQGLADRCSSYGVKFLYGTEVDQIKLNHDHVAIQVKTSDECIEKFNTHTITADVILICGGVNSYQLAQQLNDRVNIYPVKGYSITVNLAAEANRIKAPWVSLLDERAKIVSSRLGENRLRVAGTAEFNGYNRDIRADRIFPLLQWTRENFNLRASDSVPWAGLRPMTPSMLPKVEQGKHSRVFYNTGHGHLGWTLSAATAEMIAHQIHQKYPN